MAEGTGTEDRPLFFPAWLRYATLGLAALSFVVGAVAVFTTTNEIGTAAMVAASAGLIVVVVFADRIQTFEAGPIKATLPRQAAKQLEQAGMAEARGNVDEAHRLRESARILLDGAAPPVSTRLNTRQTEEPGQKLTGMQHLLMSHTRALAVASTSADTVRALFGEGSDGDRLTAIAIMQARPELADPKTLKAAVVDARSAHEQYQALVAIEKVVDASLEFPRERRTGGHRARRSAYEPGSVGIDQPARRRRTHRRQIHPLSTQKRPAKAALKHVFRRPLSVGRG